MPKAPRVEYHIPSVQVFLSYWKEPFDLLSENFDTILDDLVEAATIVAGEEGFRLTTNATANTRGRWYEWLIALGFRYWKQSSKAAIKLIKLPNRSAIHAYDSFLQPDYAEKVSLLRHRLAQNSMSLVTSNPDFILVADTHEGYDFEYSPARTLISEATIKEIDTEYLEHLGRCSPDQIFGYLAAKTSTRPDRRLQLVHEASVYKAVAHYSEFPTSPNRRRLCFWAVAQNLNSSDINALQSVALHTLGDKEPQKAINQIFQVQDFSSLQQAFAQIREEIEF